VASRNASKTEATELTSKTRRIRRRMRRKMKRRKKRMVDGWMEREEYGDSTSCRNFGEARERDEQLSLSLARLCASGPTSGIFCAPQQVIAQKKKEN